MPLTEARQIPVGSILETTHGVVGITTATTASRKGKLQSGDFGAGIFKLLQQRRQKGLTDLNIIDNHSARQVCATLGKARQRPARPSSKVLGRLNASGHGHFTARGQYSAATVRGTIWSVANQCDGTLTRVTRGVVSVRDFRRRKTNSVVRSHTGSNPTPGSSHTRRPIPHRVRSTPGPGGGGCRAERHDPRPARPEAGHRLAVGFDGGRPGSRAARSASSGPSCGRRRGGGQRELAIVALGATGFGIVAYETDLLRSLELSTVDTRFSIRGDQRPPSNIVLVEIDETTFDELGFQWPFPRRVHARVIENIARDHPAVIAYDVQFSEASPCPLRERLPAATGPVPPGAQRRGRAAERAGQRRRAHGDGRDRGNRRARQDAVPRQRRQRAAERSGITAR